MRTFVAPAGENSRCARIAPTACSAASGRCRSLPNLCQNIADRVFPVSRKSPGWQVLIGALSFYSRENALERQMRIQSYRDTARRRRSPWRDGDGSPRSAPRAWANPPRSMVALAGSDSPRGAPTLAIACVRSVGTINRHRLLKTGTGISSVG